MNPAKICALMFALTVNLLPGQAGNSTEAVNLLSPVRWVAVGDGTTLEAHEQGLRIHYTRKRGVAFGAAMPLPNSLPVDFRRFRIETDAPKGSMLLLSLRRDDGAVHSWPMRPGSEDGPLQFDLAREDLAWDRFQNTGRTELAFAPERVNALSVTDISGYLGGVGAGKTTLTVRSLAFGEATPATAGNDPTSGMAAGERMLFDALVRGKGDVDGAIAALRLEVLQQPRKARAQLLLGLAHLWRATEGDRNDPTHLDDALLADTWFSRVKELDPSETRLPSWQVPTRLTLASMLGRPERIEPLRVELRAAAARDVGFHGFALALIAWTSDKDSAPAREGLAAVRAMLAASATPVDDPSVRNATWWPHNREGFLLFAADYERRAGDTKRARQLLASIEGEPGFAEWPFRGLVAQRREAWQRGDNGVAADRFWLEGQSCVICHRGR